MHGETVVVSDKTVTCEIMRETETLRRTIKKKNLRFLDYLYKKSKKSFFQSELRLR